MTVNEIDKMLKDKSIDPALKMQLEKKKEIMLNDKKVNK